MKEVVRAILNYQYGDKIGDKIFNNYSIELEVSKNTERIRRIYINNKLFGTVDATTGFIILTYFGASIVKKYLNFPKYRVVISEEAIPFVSKGKSVFCKFVENVDENILPNDVVLVVDKDDSLIATGVSLLSGLEMKDFQRGIAIKVKYARETSREV